MIRQVVDDSWHPLAQNNISTQSRQPVKSGFRTFRINPREITLQETVYGVGDDIASDPLQWRDT